MQTNAPFFHVAPIPAASKISPSLLVRRDGQSSPSCTTCSSTTTALPLPRHGRGCCQNYVSRQGGDYGHANAEEAAERSKGLGGGRDGGSDGGSAAMDVFAAKVQAALASSHPSSSSSPSSPSLLSRPRRSGGGPTLEKHSRRVSHFFRLKAETENKEGLWPLLKFK